MCYVTIEKPIVNDTSVTGREVDFRVRVEWEKRNNFESCFENNWNLIKHKECFYFSRSVCLLCKQSILSQPIRECSMKDCSNLVFVMKPKMKLIKAGTGNTRRVDFSKWWSHSIIKKIINCCFRRKFVVCNGAAIFPEMEPSYSAVYNYWVVISYQTR